MIIMEEIFDNLTYELKRSIDENYWILISLNVIWIILCTSHKIITSFVLNNETVAIVDNEDIVSLFTEVLQTNGYLVKVSLINWIDVT